MTNTIKNTANVHERAVERFGWIVIAGVLIALLFGVVLAVVNAQVQDNGANFVTELNITVLSNETDPLLFYAQVYASNRNIGVEEVLYRFQLQDIVGKLDAELSMKEKETFTGLWIEHSPKFKIVVQFTRDGENTIKPYLKKYPEIANIIEMRTANTSLSDLRMVQKHVLYSARALGILMDSGINVRENRVELYVDKNNISRFDDTLQRKKIQLSDDVMAKIKVIPVEKLAESTANIYGGLTLSDCTSGFAVKKWNWSSWSWIKGITTAGHCLNIQTYNGNNLPFQSQNVGGSYDIQWNTAPGYTVINKIRWWSSGLTTDITEIKSRSNQVIGEAVCKYGKTTRYTCGTISDKDFDPNYNWEFGDTSPTFIRVASTEGFGDLSAPGDSGSPWFLSHTAYGTMSGQIGDEDAIYMAVDYINSGLGVFVMTSP